MKTQKLATRDDKIRGLISIALMLAGYTFAFWQTDQKYMIPGLICGFGYMLSTIAIVFKDM